MARLVLCSCYLYLAGVVVTFTQMIRNRTQSASVPRKANGPDGLANACAAGSKKFVANNPAIMTQGIPAEIVQTDFGANHRKASRKTPIKNKVENMDECPFKCLLKNGDWLRRK